MPIPQRLAERHEVILHRFARGGGHRRVDAERLAHHSVEVGECVELVHGGVVGPDGEQFCAQFALRRRVLRERIQCPGRCGAAGIKCRDDTVCP